MELLQVEELDLMGRWTHLQDQQHFLILILDWDQLICWQVTECGMQHIKKNSGSENKLKYNEIGLGVGFGF